MVIKFIVKKFIPLLRIFQKKFWGFLALEIHARLSSSGMGGCNLLSPDVGTRAAIDLPVVGGATIRPPPLPTMGRTTW